MSLVQRYEGAGVAQSVYCLTTDWTTRVQSLPEAMDFSYSFFVQTSSEAHPVSYPMVTGGPFFRGMTLTTHTLSSAEVKNE
jgi:hypothetical protein